MTESRQTDNRAQITITAGAWIGIVSITLTIVLSLFGAAGWIISRIERLDARMDTLAEEVARMRGQLDVLTQTRAGEPTEPEPGSTTGQ